MAILIRTLLIEDDVLELQSGRGIVFDSDPEKEWEERDNKVKALTTVLKGS